MADYGQYIQLAMSVLGELGAGASEDEAKWLLQRAYDEYGKIDLPALQEVLAKELGPSAMEGVQADPELAGLERQSLDELLRIGRGGGLTLEDKARLNEANEGARRTARAGEGRIREQMAARGIAGGGAELAMQLSNSQAATQRAHEAGRDTAARAERRALDSILEAGRQAGGMRRNDFSEKAARASASDARTRYNADAAARAQYYNAGLPQQQFGNRVALAAGKSGQAGALANFHMGQGASTRAGMRGLGKAAGNLGSAPRSTREEDPYDSRWDNLREADIYDYE